MTNFKLTIVCPDGCKFDGEAEFIRLRTTEGDIGILPHHINYFAAIGMGPAEVKIADQRRKGACIGGMLSVANNEVKVVTSSFEWAEEIDVERAKNSLQLAESKLADPALSKEDKAVFESRRRRALVRLSVADAK